jgi:hypothetical protein
VRRRGSIPTAWGTVAGEIAGDRRGTSPQPQRDAANRLTRGPAQGEFFSLLEREVAALGIKASAGADPTGLAQPRQTTVTMCTGQRGSVGEELTALPGGPKRLDQVGNHLLGEANSHSTPSRSRALRPPREPKERPTEKSRLPSDTVGSIIASGSSRGR